ncbi:bifunctional RNase H/acid phosphatase [Streptomyces sp. NBC_00847]|uniref:bifunctional RNase H/acid phosphatase n=1 Tax=Streptomyces sp. NBC_00847 TaxID=2975850 RepID=UPI002257A046|nr:bifunctional RNase H/acid phosphatase [Streptomyces sp. NBC_00847]MCX4880441.1 bifunctional RNase H/acid phosphatase [Streptomyces sp. NBC_00847]
MREFMVEADGGSRGNPGPAGYGSVVIDAATGETLVEAAEYIGVATNNVAEYRGLLAGLRAARDLDPSATVHVRMDSKLVVEQMSGRWKIKHPDMKPLATEAARVLPPEQVTYEWIPRERNKHADRLANEAMDAGKRGEQWSPSASTAELDARAARLAAPEPSGPPGDAAAGAARARAALAEARPAPTGSAPAAPASSTAASASTAAAPATPASPAAPGSPSAATTSPSAVPVTPSAASASASSSAPPASPSAAPSATSASSSAVPSDRSGAVEARGETGGAGAKAEADVRAARTVASPGWAPADMGAPATFVLLRHGETPLTPQKRFSGSGGTDPSLSDVGREQAERVGAALARRGTIQAIVASPLARTRETANIVAARLGLEVSVDDGLRETDFGAWEGLTFGEVRERYPDDMNAWLADPEARPTGGGESFAATAARIAVARDKLVAAYTGRTVLLVTHVTPIKTFVRLALGAPPESLFRMELSAASLSAVAYYADGNASVRLFNDTSHLR